MLPLQTILLALVVAGLASCILIPLASASVLMSAILEPGDEARAA